MIKMLQERLAATGYDVPVSGNFCPQTSFPSSGSPEKPSTDTNRSGGLSNVGPPGRYLGKHPGQVLSEYNTLRLGDQCVSGFHPAKEIDSGGTPRGSERGVRDRQQGGVWSRFRRLISWRPQGMWMSNFPEPRPSCCRGRGKKEGVGTAPGIDTSLVRCKNILVAPQVAEAPDRMSRAARGDGVVIQPGRLSRPHPTTIRSTRSGVCTHECLYGQSRRKPPWNGFCGLIWTTVALIDG